jgi:hypothetical protein
MHDPTGPATARDPHPDPPTPRGAAMIHNTSTLSTHCMNQSKPETPGKHFERYGQLIPDGTSALAVELWGYRTNRGPELGGLGAEGHFRNAFKMAWPNFIWHDWMEMLVTAWCNERHITVIGHSRATKTYGAAHLSYLDYASSPMTTWTSLATTSFDGLRSRMWGDLMAAIETANFKCPFKVTSTSNEMKIRTIAEDGSKKDEKFMIEGIAIAANGAGRIQGKHAGRRRLILDEAQELPDAIWTAEVNAGTSPDFKSVRLANPVEKLSRFGRECCEPADGWSSIHDTDLKWRDKAGRLVLHFDGLQCHNYKLYMDMGRGAITREEYEKKKLPFMLSAEYIEEVRISPGEDSVEWWMYVRGFFPTDGLVDRVFPDVFIERMKPNIIFDFPPEKFSVLDPAYEMDDCVLHHGAFGKRRDGKMGIQFETTEIIQPKVGADAEETKDEQIAAAVMDSCVKWGTKPENYTQDTTGNGRSVFSHLSRIWSRKIVGTEFGGKPTDRPVDTESTALCNELYQYFVDELHFRMAKWAQSGQVGGLANLHANTMVDLGTRRYFVKDRKRRVETKKELKKRLGRSPDFGDAFILVGELMVRKGIHPTGIASAETNDLWAAARKRALKACKLVHGEPTFNAF